MEQLRAGGKGLSTGQLRATSLPCLKICSSWSWVGNVFPTWALPTPMYIKKALSPRASSIYKVIARRGFIIPLSSFNLFSNEQEHSAISSHRIKIKTKMPAATCPFSTSDLGNAARKQKAWPLSNSFSRRGVIIQEGRWGV